MYTLGPLPMHIMERPQRHRRGVNHYSDDNPSTFTVKRRRGEHNHHHHAAAAALSPSFSSVSDFGSNHSGGGGVIRENSAERRAARAEGRRHHRRYSPPLKPPLSTRSQVSPTTNGVSATTTKRGPGRPPNPNSKRRKRLLMLQQKEEQRRLEELKRRQQQTPGTNNNGETTADSGLEQQQHEGTSDNRSLSSSPLSDEIIAHAVSINPVLPLACPDRPTLAQRYPQLYQNDDKIPRLIRTQAPPTASTATSGVSSSSSSNNEWRRITDAHKERWVPLQQQGSNPMSKEEQSYLALPAAPWTCFAVRKDNPLFFCVGDAAGNLLLYNSQPPARCIQSVVTTAGRREANRPILWTQTTQKGNMSYPNSVGAVTWQKNICVVWTRQEVEIIDVVQHKTLAYLPLDSSGLLIPNHLSNSTLPSAGNLTPTANSKRQIPFSFQSLDLHPTDSLLLWRPQNTTKNTTGDEVGNGANGSVSLYCIDFSKGPADVQTKSVTLRGENKSNSSDCICHGAVWDNHSRTEILAVISQQNEKDGSSSRASLCRMTVEGDISIQTTLPESGNVSGRTSSIYTDCVLEQYDSFLFLCSGRGIRCYETNRLTFLTVYGETVALHSKTVGWQACFWIPEPSFDPSEIVISSANGSGGGSSLSSKNRQSCWIHRADQLAQVEQAQGHEKSLLRQESNGSAQTNGSSSVNHPTNLTTTSAGSCSKTGNKLFSNMLLVGVPHPSRGPTELQSTLYVWKPGEVLPLTTLQVPPGGLLGLHIHHTPTAGWRLTCANAKNGQGWQLSPSFQSDFAGTMYPVGYQILNDNIEYLEDEAELDKVIVIPHQHPIAEESPQRTSREDYDLQKALKQSLVTAAENPISVLLDEDEQADEDDQVMVPCAPDPSLREVFEENDPASPKSPNRRVRSTPHALTLFPQYSASKMSTMEQQQEQARRQTMPPPPLTAEESAAQQQQAAMKLKGKRSRIATVEALLQASVNPVLKHKMTMLHKEWSNPGGMRYPNHLWKNGHGGKSSVTSDVDMTMTGESSRFVSSDSTASGHQNKSTPVPFRVSSDAATVSDTQSPQISEDSMDDIHRSGKESTVTPPQGLPSAFCAACQGRMVIHVCGKRDLPVDMEALEKAERLRKEQEQAELKRQRAEKRRLAEAKRRENRRKQKELEDRRLYAERMEEERLLRMKMEQEQEQRRQEKHAEVLRIVQANTVGCLPQDMTQPPESQQQQQQQPHPQRSSLAGDYSLYQLPTSLMTRAPAPPPRPSIPKFSELQSGSGHNGSSTSNKSNGGSTTHGYSNSAPHGFYQAPTPAVGNFSSSSQTDLHSVPSQIPGGTTSVQTSWISTEGNNGSRYCQDEGAEEQASMTRRRELTTTFTASDGDALAALVGLADSLAPARTSTATTHSEGHYDYSGSSDRRSAILAQYSSQFKQLESSFNTISAPSVTYEHSESSLAAAPIHTTSVTATNTLRFLPNHKNAEGNGNHSHNNNHGNGILNSSVAAASHENRNAESSSLRQTYSSHNGQQVWADRTHSNT